MSRGKGAGKKTRIPGLKSTRGRQYLTLGGLAVGLYLVFYIIFVSADKKPSRLHVKGDVETTRIRAPGEHLDPREAWIGGAGKEVADMKARMRKQDELNESLERKLKELQGKIGKEQERKAEEAPPPIIVKEKVVTEPAAAGSSGVFPPATPAQVVAGLTGSQAESPAGVGGWFRGQSSSVQPTKAPTRALGHFRIAPRSENELESSETKKAAERLSGETFLPVGIVKASLIGGIDAPTGGQAQSHPLPVMLKINDLAILPNQFRANVKECMAVGAAYGELSAERAYARIELLSCIRHDGEVLETPVHGVVYDETGKLGMRGYVRTKQGQILANALLSGVIGGIGRGFAMSATDTSTSVLGTVSNVSGSDAYRAGVGQGVGRALDRLADYYIRLAEQLFPVIEVHGGRSVDIAFTKGVRLPVALPDEGSMAMGYYDED